MHSQRLPYITLNEIVYGEKEKMASKEVARLG